MIGTITIIADTRRVRKRSNGFERELESKPITDLSNPAWREALRFLGTAGAIFPLLRE
jgi:hypothetical protein